MLMQLFHVKRKPKLLTNVWLFDKTGKASLCSVNGVSPLKAASEWHLESGALRRHSVGQVFQSARPQIGFPMVDTGFAS
jgi:hypothetical protein